MKRTKITEELKEEIISYYLSKPMSYKQVCEKFGICSPTVGKILKDCPKYPKNKIFNPNLNERFFENIDCEEKAYFLGLIISDGNVFIPEENSENRSASISITLDLKDEYILEKFGKVLGANVKVGHDGRGCGQLAIRSNQMAKDLAKYGVVPRKSFNTYLPEIPNNMYKHLIRGIMDGDGSIQLIKAKCNNKTYKKIDFCGTHRLMEDISNKLYECLHLDNKPEVYDYKNRQLSEIHIQNLKDILKYCNWIYEGATIYLKRKFDKYLEIINYYKQDNTEVTEEIKESSAP